MPSSLCFSPSPRANRQGFDRKWMLYRSVQLIAIRCSRMRMQRLSMKTRILKTSLNNRARLMVCSKLESLEKRVWAAGRVHVTRAGAGADPWIF